MSAPDDAAPLRPSGEPDASTLAGPAGLARPAPAHAAPAPPAAPTPPSAAPGPSALAFGLPVGCRLGRYEVRGLLGRGGMGQVYLAEDAEDPARPRVAIKVLSPSLALRAEGVRRFEKEREHLARLRHPNVVAALGPLERDPSSHLAWFAMELVLGKSLADLLDEHGRFPLDEAARVGRALAAALGAAHAAGIVHRDVKPSNVLVDAHGHVRLSDFGLARSVDQSQLTQTGAALGTPAYMAPEQAEGGDVGPPADLYGLGALLFELVAGRPPFRAASPLGLLRMHADEPPPLLRALRPDAPAGLEALVARLLAKAPEARGEAADLERDLAALERALAPDASGFWARISGEVAREAERALDAAAHAITETPGAVAVVGVVRGAEDVGERQGAGPPARWRRLLAGVALAAIVLALASALWAMRERGDRTPEERAVGSAGAPDADADASATAGERPSVRAGRPVTIELRDGRVFVGRLLGYEGANVVFSGPDGVERRFARSDLKRLDFRPEDGSTGGDS